MVLLVAAEVVVVPVVPTSTTCMTDWPDFLPATKAAALVAPAAAVAATDGAANDDAVGWAIWTGIRI